MNLKLLNILIKKKKVPKNMRNKYIMANIQYYKMKLTKIRNKIKTIDPNMDYKDYQNLILLQKLDFNYEMVQLWSKLKKEFDILTKL